MTPEEFADIAARIHGCGELSGMEYEDTIDRIALQDAPLLLAEVHRLQAECESWQKLGERTIRAEADRSEIQRMYQRASDEARRYRVALIDIRDRLEAADTGEGFPRREVSWAIHRVAKKALEEGA